jgi:hypothetical protein
VYAWLTNTCGYSIWYDAVHFPTGLVGTQLGVAIEKCQSAIIVLSTASIESGWVEQEWNICLEQQTKHPDFAILQLRIDDCTPPAALRVRKWIDVKDNISADAAIQIIEAYHSKETDPNTIGRRQIYLSRGNRPNEVKLANLVCERLRQASVRIVRDAPDQDRWDVARIRNIMQGCGGFLAFVPNRSAGATSKYILEEISIARSLGLPFQIFIDRGVDISSSPLFDPSEVLKVDLDCTDAANIFGPIDRLSEDALEPLRPSHCFIGHSFKHDQDTYWPVARRAIQVVTGLPCVSGDDLPGGDIQAQIVNRIREAEFSIFDITEDRLNSCIEAGIALGAGANFALVCKAPRRRPPFMFRNRQVFFYATHGDLVGLMARLAHPYRRVVV